MFSVPILTILVPLFAWAGLECHETDIQKAVASLGAVAASECKNPAALRAADRQLRELGFESSCDPDLLDKSKQIVRELRIDAWINRDLAACNMRITEATGYVRALNKDKIPAKNSPPPKATVKTE